MARPLMQHGVGQLEEMFAKGKADAKVLKQLENELQYRQVPRAVALLAEVQAAMYGGAPDAFAAFPGPLQRNRFFRQTRKPDNQRRPRSSPLESRHRMFFRGRPQF